MIPGRIQNATRTLNAPRDWDGVSELPVGALPILDYVAQDVPAMASAWLPTPEELTALAAGAPVILSIVGRSHPIVGVGVGEPPE